MHLDYHPYGGLLARLIIFKTGSSVALGAFSLALAVATAAGCHRPESSPSVLLIIVDTLRADHVGSLRPDGRAPAAGSATPSIDRWSAGAARFRRAITPAPFTMPAMAGLLSGAYPDRCGVVAHEPGTSFATWHGTTLAESARKAGLATAAVIANPWLSRTGTGFDRGFDEFARLYRPEQAAGASSATVVTTEALRILETNRDRRFFLWVHYFDPHMPYQPPSEFARAAGASSEPSRVMDDFNADGRDLHRLYRGEGYSADEIHQARRLYEGEVRYVDHEIGRLLDRLASLGLAEETIVVVASDHGESLGEHGLYFAHDYTLYEELTHIPLAMRGPGIAPGNRNDTVSLLDVAPTICRLARLPCATDVDGRDLFASPRGGRTLFAATTPLRAKGTPFDRLEVPGLAGRWTMALDDDTKLVRMPTRAGVGIEMYNLSRDPRELHDIAQQSADESRTLAAKVEAWSAAMDAARPAASSSPTRRQQRRDERALRSLGYLQ